MDQNIDWKVGIFVPTNSTYATPQFDNGKLYLDNQYPEDVAIVQNAMFEEIFEDKKSVYLHKHTYLSRLPIVKLTNGNRSIYRRIELASKTNFSKDKEIICISPKSLGELANISYDSNNKPKPIRLEPNDKIDVQVAGWLPFYFYHPDSATRMPFILGLPSLLIGIISLIIGFVSLL